MEQSNNYLKELCNELAQPITTLTLTMELLERGLAVPQDLVAMKFEIERLNQIVRSLRDTNNSPKVAQAA